MEKRWAEDSIDHSLCFIVIKYFVGKADFSPTELLRGFNPKYRIATDRHVVWGREGHKYNDAFRCPSTVP